ncbi:MAG: hypothetical protein IKQ01_03325 [Bacteroidales bacterium]|jgi:hypothetical protein|nr:hypothetical protein [Bacteroidales bacterium]
MDEIGKGEQIYQQGRINHAAGNASINCLVSYYESEEQDNAILSVCNNHEILQQLMEELNLQSESMISPISNYEVLSTIVQGLHFEDDTISKRVMAVAPLPADNDASYVEAATDSLQCFIRELQRTFLSNVILDKMPVVELVDKERALFYLEMSMWYNGGVERVIKPIDWFDIRKVWEKSHRFWFYPTFSAETMMDLSELIQRTAEVHSGLKEKRCVLWFDVPEESDEDPAGIQDVVWQLRERGVLPLWGLRCIPKRKGINALLFLMEV